jgi:hypothetical protein
MSDEKQKVKIKCDIFWCQHNRMNEMSGAYQVNLGNLSDAAVAALEEMGVSVREKTDLKDGDVNMGKYITCKSQKPMRVFDVDGEPIEEAIGNGSKGKALISAYEWTYKNKKGVSPSCLKLVVTDLVEYSAGAGISADDEDVL